MDHLENPQTRTGQSLDGGEGRRGPIVIDVSDVDPARAPLRDVPYRAALDAAIVAPPRTSPFDPPYASESDGPAPIEACSDEEGRLVPTFGSHAGLAAIHLAYADHRPIVLSPDIIWMFIAQGLALHIKANAEALRRHFVRHQGRVILEVRRDEFVKGSRNNDWAAVFEEFSLFIRAHIGEATHALLEPRFSTTGAVEKAAAQVALLDAMQPYFSYRLTTMCGIPRVMLHGDRRDWVSLAERVEALREFDLEWWTDPLRPILAEFVAAADGGVNTEFWQRIYKQRDGSGGPYISGWVTALFPYLHDSESRLVPNWALRDGGTRLQRMLAGTGRGLEGLTSNHFPRAMTEAPFEWQYYGDRYDMRFAAGFVGVRQDPETMSVRPEIGWAVYEPKQVEAARAVREQESTRARNEAAGLASARAQAWTSKARCQRCGEWIYRYDNADPPKRHCGEAVVDVAYR